MSTILRIDSFSETNLEERTELTFDYTVEALTLIVRSTEGYSDGQTIYVGQLSREGCESAVIASVVDETTINLVSALKLPHSCYEPVTAVLGGSIHIYRAPNTTGNVPGDDQFTVLTTRTIDPDQLSTYYRDSTGSSDFWYSYAYFNPVTNEETERSTPFRGDDFEHYASLAEIRKEAGFEKAYNLADSDVELQRRIAETEINASLSGAYTVPFNPVPAIINTLTIQLASAFLLIAAYGETSTNRQKRDSARKDIEAYKNRESVLTDDNGIAMTSSDTVTGWPGDPSPEAPRFFHMRDKF
ncbi:phage protein Gp36 family protein [Paeniglutamicibacter sp. NPDC091659]|uniref:phage protein Gp36 family protein n=1 Tax=Paeniglutamicibacter sp. NPDC091659 TaxID=3364389 RepID=UPI0037FCE184